MGADGANSGCLFADDDVAAVTALPYCIAVFREDELAFDVGEQFAIAVFVSFFDGTDHFEELGDVIEAFFASFFRKRGIHIGPFVVFALSCVEEVFGSRRDFVVVEAFEPEFRVLFFVFGSFEEDFGDLFEAVFLRLRSVVGVFIASLGFAGESGLEVGFCFGAF